MKSIRNMLRCVTWSTHDFQGGFNKLKSKPEIWPFSHTNPQGPRNPSQFQSWLNEFDPLADLVQLDFGLIVSQIASQIASQI